ncbi:MAG: putative aliphatic sulfonates transport permease protein SsuC [Pelotomaculum sp. PtaU1.Bin035]|nr:MAG: putative aliphatic sulfonates transport permease protein SsuC [Pelotomaculum sp. PtaU1.Bin035]
MSASELTSRKKTDLQIELGELKSEKHSVKKDLNLMLVCKLLLPVLLWGIFWVAHLFIADRQILTGGKYFNWLMITLLGLYLIFLVISYFISNIRSGLVHKVPLISAVLMILLIWELTTLKLNLLPLPYFPPPAKVFAALAIDWQTLWISVLYSLRLLGIGYLIGLLVGLPCGTLMGWYAGFNYWLNPVLRFIGPIPATAWIPVAMAVFPTSFAASIFLIALASWFPITVMTWSGIANVNKAFYEVARTLGGGEYYLITRVAVPAALPSIFVGLFMGMGTAFVTLVVGELLGVKAGLGWYIQWAQGWAEYAKVYAALFVMAVIFSGLITLLFRIRDKVLVWQRGLIKW